MLVNHPIRSPLGGLRMRVFAALLAGLGLASEARAACDASGAETIEVAHITQDFDIALTDGRTIRLDGVKMLPEAAHPTSTQLSGWIAAAAGGAPLKLRLLTPIADRWGRVAGDLFIGDLHLQSALARAGLAVADPHDMRGACWPDLKAAESDARRASVGLWADKENILSATDAPGLDRHDGLFILASGRVRHISRGKEHRRSYIDFGRRGDGALFLTIEAKALTRMDKLGFKLEQLTDRTILVRGVVLRGRAPHMVIDDVDAIDFWD